MPLQELVLEGVALEELIASIVEESRRHGTNDMDSKALVETSQALLLGSELHNLFDH